MLEKQKAVIVFQGYCNVNLIWTEVDSSIIYLSGFFSFLKMLLQTLCHSI